MPKNRMTQDAARRIQSHADRTGRNQDFKDRARSTADRATLPQPAAPANPPRKQGA